MMDGLPEDMELPISGGHILKWGSVLGRRVYIDDVRPGDIVTCLDCHEILVPRLGTKIQHHFAHKSGSDCHGETAAHKLGKDIIVRNATIRTPACYRIVRARKVGIPGGFAEYSHAVLEKRLAGTTYIPDVLVSINNRLVAVEIKVTHSPEEEKCSRFRELGIDILEIDCAALMGLPKEAQDDFVLRQAPRRWLVNKDVDLMIKDVQEEKREISSDKIKKEIIETAKKALSTFQYPKRVPTTMVVLTERERKMATSAPPIPVGMGNPFTISLNYAWAIIHSAMSDRKSLTDIFYALAQRNYIQDYATDELAMKAVYKATGINITPMHTIEVLSRLK